MLSQYSICDNVLLTICTENAIPKILLDVLKVAVNGQYFCIDVLIISLIALYEFYVKHNCHCSLW